jgi:IrrE N-terminal-like domain
MNFEGWSLQRWANHFNQMLNIANPPDRYKFDIGKLAMETSQSLFPGDPITEVKEEDLDGFAGALVPAKSRTRWGIVYGRRQSSGRRRFTAAHEFGHYLLHRKKYPHGIHSSEADVGGRTKVLIEREANEFSFRSERYDTAYTLLHLVLLSRYRESTRFGGGMIR